MRNGQLHVMIQWWFHQPGFQDPGMASLFCTYKVWEDSEYGPIVVSHVRYRDGDDHSEAGLMAGELPGRCSDDLGVAPVAPEWMHDAAYQAEPGPWYCSSDCGPFACSMD